MEDDNVSEVVPVGPDRREGQVAALVAIGVSVVVAGFSWALACGVQQDCLHRGLCTELGDGTCSFQNAVTPAGLGAFNLSLGNGETALSTLTRGVCVAGERQGLDAFGRVACFRAPTYPDAFNAEAADPEAVRESERACGRWMRGRSADRVEMFGFWDEPAIADDVVHQTRLETASGAAVDDIGRFRRSCEQMLVNSAAAPAAQEAFDYLSGALGERATSTTRMLEQVGVLVAHYCDAPLALAHGITTAATFAAVASDGTAPNADVVSEALYAFGATADERERARRFADELASAPTALLTDVTTGHLDAVVVGAVGNSWLADSVQIHGTFGVASDGALTTLQRFLHAKTETSHAHAHAYLRGLAGRCSFAARSVVTGEFGVHSAIAIEADALLARDPLDRRAVALGRLASPIGADQRLIRVDAADLRSAATIGWSRLRGTHTAAVGSASEAHAIEACWEAAMRAFPDELDERVFAKLTTPALLARLEAMVEPLKVAVATELTSGRTSGLVADPAQRAALADRARRTHFGIAGAPRGSRFGRPGGFDPPATHATDGALKLMLLQGHAVFLDRLALSLEHQDVCALPPLFPSTSRNAYMLTVASCATLLPGILVPPLASDRFDDASLYARIGFVMAHEVAHVASDASLWDAARASQILVNYTSNVAIEAAADLTAADAVISTSKATPEQLCGAQAQLWCARTPGGSSYAPDRTSSHPPPNVRGDNLCAWLKHQGRR
jgi:hypothetical protein